MEKVNSLLEFIKLAVLTTAGQLITLLGIFFVFGLLLYLLARFTRVVFVRSIGHKADMVWTGWLGTPVHELGHALFCILFRHRIVSMKLYDPNPTDGSLGYVNHSYNPRNAYQNIGNFFIGAGPIILGALVLYAAMYYLLPNKMEVVGIINSKSINLAGLAGLSTLKSQGSIFLATGSRTLKAIFTEANLRSWTFWLFLYISLCVASHMELSPPDLKGMWSGLATLVILLFAVNVVALFLGYNINRYIMVANSYTGLFTGLFIYATIISAVNFMASFALLSIYSLVVNRRLFSPFA
jgi:hypothetical protein